MRPLETDNTSDAPSSTPSTEPGPRGRKRISCSADGCPKRPSFAAKTGQRPLRCKSHKALGDTNVKHRRCAVAGCSSRSRFGMPGSKSVHCTAHRQPGATACEEVWSSGTYCQPVQNLFGTPVVEVCEVFVTGVHRVLATEVFYHLRSNTLCDEIVWTWVEVYAINVFSRFAGSSQNQVRLQ